MFIFFYCGLAEVASFSCPLGVVAMFDLCYVCEAMADPKNIIQNILLLIFFSEYNYEVIIN